MYMQYSLYPKHWHSLRWALLLRPIYRAAPTAPTYKLGAPPLIFHGRRAVITASQVHYYSEALSLQHW